MSAKHTQGKVIPAVSSFSPIGPCYAVGVQGTKVAIAITGKFDEPNADISEAKHTPGPWEIRRGYDTIIDSIGPCIPEEYAGSAWLKLSEADARLIAAAPELLEALKQCRLALEPYDDVKPRDWKTDREKLAFAHQAARAAISKAESNITT